MNLQEILDNQFAFQLSVDERCDSISQRKRTAYIKDHVVNTEQELHEMLQELPFFKRWKDYSGMTDKDKEQALIKAKEEYVDAFIFFINVGLGLGFDATQLYEGYWDKYKENKRRQDEGYTFKQSSIGIQDHIEKSCTCTVRDGLSTNTSNVFITCMANKETSELQTLLYAPVAEMIQLVKALIAEVILMMQKAATDDMLSKEDIQAITDLQDVLKASFLSESFDKVLNKLNIDIVKGDN